MPALASLLCGFIFGTGLVISGMVKTTKVLGFLDVLGILNGTWKHGRPLVMAAGLLVAGIGYALIRPHAPIFAPKSLWPSATDIDRPLLAGAALFGIGWGPAGFFSGPADAALETAIDGVIVFVIAMAVGMAAHDLWQARSVRQVEQKLATATDG